MPISKEQQAHDLAVQFTKEYFDSQNNQFNYRKNESEKKGIDFKENQTVITTAVWFEMYITFYREFSTLLEDLE